MIIKCLHLLLFSMFLLTAQAQAQAQAQANNSVESKNAKFEFEGNDITAFVEHYKKSVKTLKKSVTIYNWSRGASKSFWQKEREQGDPDYVTAAMIMSQSFWYNYGSSANSNMYGNGLYAAVDPVATTSYGGISKGSNFNNEWILLEMKLPTGFKMIETYEPTRKIEQLDQFSKTAKAYNCPATGSINELFEGGGNTLHANCSKLVRYVFKDILKIEGFTYSYGALNFKDCSFQDYAKNYVAFVITSDSWITGDNIRFYTEKTKSNVEDRLRIQTVFLHSIENASDYSYGQSSPKQEAIERIVSYLKLKPESFVKGSTVKCEAETCLITVQMCSSKTKDCEDLKLNEIPRPGGPNITAREAKMSWIRFNGAGVIFSWQCAVENKCCKQ